MLAEISLIKPNKMKALLSTKTLYEALKKIDFDKVSVVQEVIIEDNLKLTLSDYTEVSIPCKNLGFISERYQFQVDWRNVREIVQRVPEMPFVLTLDGNRASLTFEV